MEPFAWSWWQPGPASDMTTVAELVVAEEIVAIREASRARGWTLEEPDSLHFLLGLPASDKSLFHLFVDCADYPVMPPAWHWCDGQGLNQRDLKHAPKGSGFLHQAGVICAPWNRLAYQVIDRRGPHGEWTISDWRNNSNTLGCKTLGAMALRVYVELNGSLFAKQRLAA